MNKIIFKTIFGSYLYGTSINNVSDKDFKGVFIADIKDIILKLDSRTISESTNTSSEKNNSDDIDCEFKELREFIKDCVSGQTYALDMLFAPPQFWIESTKDWFYIYDNRSKLVSKSVAPYVGYCRRQAGKYGLKGSRLGVLLNVIEILKDLPQKDILSSHLDKFEYGEFLEITISPKNNEKYLTVLGKSFQLNLQINNVLKSCEETNKRYGERAKLAYKNEGIDYKAISHAFRCCYQLQELAETGEIIFPLKRASYLKEIKAGKLNYSDIKEVLYEEMEKAIEMVEKSNLPEKVNTKFWDEFILSKYI